MQWSVTIQGVKVAYNLRVEFRFQRLNHLLPILVGCQASARGAADGMPGIELHVKRVEGMTTRAD